jgi:phosphoserine phosphatase
MVVRAADPAGVRAALVQAAADTGVDIAVEAAGLRRRAKRLVALDLDSTLIRTDVIDVVAGRAGRADQAKAITDRAGAGEIGSADALRARVELLSGLPQAVLDDVRDQLELTAGAQTFVRTLRRLGYHVGVVSAGIGAVLSPLVAELDLDFAAANELEVVDGVLTGELVGPILDATGKADALARFAEKFGVPLSQTVAVGDGATDGELLAHAGLGIAFNATAALRASADPDATVGYLDSVLFVLGISADDIAEAAPQ